MSAATASAQAPSVTRVPLDISQLPERGEIVIDGAGHVAGRLATYIVRVLLSKPELWVYVINAEKIVITGCSRVVTLWFARKISEWRTHYNPEKAGPKIPRRPDRVFKRIVRGMLPRKQWRGLWALKRLRVYMSVPLALMQRRRLVIYEIPEAKLRAKPMLKYTTLEEVWRLLEPLAWERWRRARELWERKTAQLLASKTGAPGSQ
ncbi:MAG: 50S ribosomal protein L13 [Thermoproteaceae archaeon]|jgi:large subunit ribosomal protein L13|nr:50S ribosomal protein L13 [Thermoproteaceae archaeon]